MHLGILPLENRIIKGLKERGALGEEDLESIKRDFTKMLQRTREFRDLSSMALNDVF